MAEKIWGLEIRLVGSGRGQRQRAVSAGSHPEPSVLN